jgi:phage/plasmid-associated DNA primase
LVYEKFKITFYGLKMDASLQNLLTYVADKKTSKNKSYGLTDMNSPSNLWTFKDDNMQTHFWIKYCDMVQKQSIDNSRSYNYYLGEVSDESAFIVKLDFRFFDSEEVRHTEGPFDDEFICDVIKCINGVLESHLMISDDKKELICCVLQSRKVVNDVDTPDEVNYTLQLQYPYCRTKVSVQKQVFREFIIKELARKNFIIKPGHGDWIQRYDASVPSSYIPLFGSKRKAMDEILELTHIYGPELDEDGLLVQMELADVFNPLNHSDVQSNRIDKDIFDRDFQKWLPLFLSPTYWSSVCKMAMRQEPTPSTSQEHNGRFASNASNLQNIQLTNVEEPKSSSDFLKIFIPMLKEEQKNNQNIWMDIGKAFYHATRGTLDGLNEWKKYTEKSSEFTSDMCEIKYPLFRDSLITHKTIAWHAIRDSPEKYKEWHNKWINTSMKKAIDEPLHTDLAEMFYRKHWLHFSYSSNGKVGGGKTYRFDKDGHRWRQLEDGELIIGKILTDKFLHRFEKEKINLNRELLSLEDNNIDQRKKNRKREGDRRNSKDEENDEKTKLEQSYKNVLKIITILGSTPQKKCVIKGIQEKLFIEGFDRNLDTNPMLVGVLNGVIEVDTKDARFRSGKPEDYLSMFTSLPYREDFNMECDAVKRYLKYLNQVFPDRELMKYMRKDIASFLKGRNAEKLFRIFSGCGNNSKSVYIKLVERAFGSYCVSIPVSVITVKRGSSSSASPETARLRGTHIATCAEPDDNETIKSGIVKSMTGNDRFFTRALFSNGEEIEAMYKLILITNKVPSIPNAGIAIKNRVIIIPFLAKFVNTDYPEDEEDQYNQKTFKMDPDFEDYVPLLSQAMLWCAVQDYRPYCQEGLKHFPDVIMNETSSYWEENDPYDLFIKEKLVKEALPEETQSPDIPDIILEVPVQDSPQSISLDINDGVREPGVREPGVREPIEPKIVESKPVEPKSTQRRKSVKKEPKYTTELLFSDANRVFKMWAKEAFPGLNPGNQEQIRKEFEGRLGPQKNRKWMGWSLREEDKNRL